MTEQLAAENVETAPQVDESLNEEQANSEEVEATAQVEGENDLTLAHDDSYVPEEALTPNIQKRINKLTWEKHEAERQAAAKIAELEAKLAQVNQGGAVGTEKVKPTLKDFDYDDEAYADALVEWKVEQRMAKFQQPTQPQVDTTVQTFQQAQKAYAAEHSEYIQIANQMANAVHSKAVEQYIMASENGPKLHHQLLNNYAELARIQQLPEWQQGAELVKFESKLTQVKKVAKSNAPAPVQPVSSGKPAPKVKGFKSGKLFPQ